jgi:2-dehydro-3-deoxyphosphogluconate aldolase/(4S)-4-hydroxy-2-oxoglutarate aldolase
MTPPAIDAIMRTAPVIPVLVIEDLDMPCRWPKRWSRWPESAGSDAAHPCALDAIRVMKQVPGAIVGAGTVLNPAIWPPPSTQGRIHRSPGLTPRWAKRR